MMRLRIIILGVAVWLSILFNLERPDVLGFNVSSVVYFLAAGLVVAILLFPDLGTLRTEVLLLGTTVLYGLSHLANFLYTPNLTAPMVISELAILLVTVFIASFVSKSVANVEQVVEGIATAADDTRILSAAEGEQVINQELFRARRFNRPVSLLVLKIDSIAELQTRPLDRVKYQTVLQQRFIRNRIGQIAESVLYMSDPIAWNSDNLVICLPETSAEQAFTLAEQISHLVTGMLNLEVPVGSATFPDDGLIYSDLVAVAGKSVLAFRTPEETHGEPSPVEHPATLSVNGAHAPALTAATVSSNGVRPTPPNVAAVEVAPRRPFSLGRLIHETTELLNQDLGVLPPLRYATVAWSDATPYYNPDFWVNRLPFQSMSSRVIYRRLKRAIDLFLVIVTLPLTLPVGLAVAAAIWLTDGSPVLFIQKRTGMGGHVFKMYKFRTMVRNADQLLREMNIRVNERGETVNERGEKLENDPRITRIGHILRKTSLDELPQLWNVLQGQMSIVGPRPTSFGVDKYALLHTQRLGVKPGITGLWQIYDRGDTDFDNRLIWDIKYIDKISLILDLQILVRTVLKVLKDRGAR